MRFPITDFFSECDQIRRKLRIWSHLLKKYVMENLIYCVVHYLLIIIQVSVQTLKSFL